jgi:hypothetical protein
MDNSRIYVDFNDEIEDGIILLITDGDSTWDASGQRILLSEGQRISIYCNNTDENGNVDNLIADAVVVPNLSIGSSIRKSSWLCRILPPGVMLESELREDE